MLKRPLGLTNKREQVSGKRRGVLRLTLPDHGYPPSGGLQCSNPRAIPFHIAVKFSGPKFDIRSGER